MNNSHGPHRVSDWFWDIIAQAEGSRTKLIAILMQFDYDQLNRFEYEYSYAAGYLQNKRFVEHMDGKSNDSVDDLTRWIVGKGKEFYMDVWNHPEHTPASEEYGDSNLAPASWHVCLRNFGDKIDEFGDLPDEEN